MEKSDTHLITIQPNVVFRLIPHCLEQMEEREIKVEWIIETLKKPILTQADVKKPDRKNAYKPISEYGDRVLKVVYNEDTDPKEVITVHFHRGMTAKYRRGEI